VDWTHLQKFPSEEKPILKEATRVVFLSSDRHRVAAARRNHRRYVTGDGRSLRRNRPFSAPVEILVTHSRS